MTLSFYSAESACILDFIAIYNHRNQKPDSGYQP